MHYVKETVENTKGKIVKLRIIFEESDNRDVVEHLKVVQKLVNSISQQESSEAVLNLLGIISGYLSCMTNSGFITVKILDEIVEFAELIVLERCAALEEESLVKRLEGGFDDTSAKM